MVIPLRDREQPTKEANPARSQAHPAGRAPSVSFRVRFLVLEKFQPDRSEDVGKSFGAISAKLGVDPVRPHDLRTTHGSTITALGFGRDAMNRIQNHREGGIASVYDRHQYADENKRVMEATAAKIMALVEGRPGTGAKVVRLPSGAIA